VIARGVSTPPNVCQGEPVKHKMSRHFTEAELQKRRPVWRGLSDLFLDTHYTKEDVRRMGALLAQSPFTLAELDEIFLWEVYPACRSNPFAIAGEWAGFDDQWLEARILRGPGGLGRLWTSTVGRVSCATSLDWRRLKDAINDARAGH